MVAKNPQRSLFRDGRWIALGTVVGATLLAVACLSGLWTAFEITESNWRSATLWRLGFTFFCLFGGCLAIVAGVLRFNKLFFRGVLASAVFAAMISIYPAGIQFWAGQTVVTGEFVSFERLGGGKRFRVLPSSKTMTSESMREAAILTLKCADDSVVDVKVRSNDLKPKMGTNNSENKRFEAGRTYRVVYLRYLQRLISAELLDDDVSRN